MNYKRLFIDGSYIFITIVTYKRRKILIKNINILRDAFRYSKTKFDYELFAIVVNPDHIHMIIVPNNINDYPKIISHIKRYFTQHIDFKYDLNEKREANIWQRRFWEHTIRDDEDLYKHLDYIHYNPIKHGYVNAVKEWQYSSFMKFVNQGNYEEDWCNFGDKYKISEMNIE